MKNKKTFMGALVNGLYIDQLQCIHFLVDACSIHFKDQSQEIMCKAAFHSDIWLLVIDFQSRSIVTGL